jgi:methenyltetrahydrofolate cyclohydrolase
MVIVMNDGVFGKVLDSKDFSTGGGSAAAIAGAMSAALSAMVARLSLKKDYGLPESRNNEILLEAEKLTKELLDGAIKDMEAFALVKEAYSLPKNKPADKKKRSARIENGFKTAAMIPNENAKLCKRALELSNLLTGKSNPSAGSDLEAARILARAAIKCCLINIKTNLAEIKDQAVVHDLESQISDLEDIL